MSLFRNTIALFGIGVLLSCSSHQTHQTPGMEQPELASAAESTPARTKANILVYYQQIPSQKNSKTGPRFEVNDPKNGYLRTASEDGTYTVYALFSGSEQDILIEQKTTCKNFCEQKIEAYRFSNGKLDQPVPFESLYSKKQVDAHLRRYKKTLPKSHKRANLTSWIRIPEAGLSLEILVLTEKPGKTQDRAAVYDAGLLNWDGQKFQFDAFNSNLPSKLRLEDVK